MAFQREPFLAMFYTINLSPLLVTIKGFMLIIILSDYQQCPLPLRSRNQIRGKLLLSRKLRYFSLREPFLTMFYTINLFLLLITM